MSDEVSLISLAASVGSIVLSVWVMQREKKDNKMLWRVLMKKQAPLPPIPQAPAPVEEPEEKEQPNIKEIMEQIEQLQKQLKKSMV